MKKRFTFILFILLFSIYMVFFPDRLHKELIVIPSWAIELKDNVSVKAAGTGVPFELENRLGYFANSGVLLYSEKADDAAVVTDDFFINYSNVSEQTVLQETDGSLKSVIAARGVPFSVKDRLFVLSPDQMRLEEFNSEGESVLALSPGSVITSMDAGEDILVLGLLNGEVNIYSGEKEPVFSYYSTESRYSIAYACAVSDDGKRLAAVTGLYPQQLICFEYRNEDWVPVFRKNVAEEYRRNILLNYSNDGRLLYIETPEGIEILSTATFLQKRIEMPGEIAGVFIPGQKKLSYLISSDEDKNLLKIYRSDLGSVADFEFPGGEVYFHPDELCIYIGLKNKIIRYDLIEG